MVYLFKTPLPKAGQSVRFASSPVTSGRQLLGPYDLKSTVGQYSRTVHTNSVMCSEHTVHSTLLWVQLCTPSINRYKHDVLGRL
jgi:hypothetical protein